MRAVRAAKGIGGFTLQFVINGRKVARRQHHVGVQHEQVVARGTLSAVVARHAGTSILFRIVMDVQPVGKMRAHLAARHLAAVLHDVDVEIAKGLLRQAEQQFRHLVGAIVDGYYDGISRPTPLPLPCWEGSSHL